MKRIKRWVMLAVLIILFAGSAQAFFYRAETMQEYCKDYLKMEQVEVKVDEYGAGICAGYMASKLEVLQLSDRLCSEEPPDLNEVVAGFIEYMQSNPQLNEQSSLRAIVSYLDSEYTCK